MLVISPPGFGKTTLLTQWRAALLNAPTPKPVAWLTLDDADTDPNRLLAYLVLAFEATGVDTGALGQRARTQALDPDPQRNVAALLQVLRQHGQRMTLMVDDYHRAASPTLDLVMLTLLERGADILDFVVASRSRPQWPLAALKARGLVQEIDAQDLVLTQSEAADILGPSYDLAALSILHARTEGWAVALQLARLWFARGQGSLLGLQSLTGPVADVAEYLAEQVVMALPLALREFLMETAVLDRFNAELADAVRGRSDAAAMLMQLRPYEALVVPLDVSRSWFRYHLMLADYLRTQLDPQRGREIHRAAAHWLGRQSDWGAAVAHAVQAGDEALAIRLLQAAGGWQLVLRKGIPYTQGLLRYFDDISLRTDPTLLMVQSYLHAKLGDEPLAMELLRLAEVSVADRPELQRDFDVIAALVHVYFDRLDDDDRWPVRAEDAMQRAPDDLLCQATLLCVGAVKAISLARLDEAIAASTAARARMRVVQSPLGENYCLLHLAQAHAMRGDLQDARRVIDEALALAESNFGMDSSLKALVGCFKAQQLYWAGDWAGAAPRLAEGLSTVEHVDGWLDVFAVTADMGWRIALRLEGLSAALKSLEHTAQQARHRRLERLSALVSAWRVDLNCQSGLMAQARQEANAAQLDRAWRAALTLGPNEATWRFVEAGAMALMRLHLALGAPREALALAELARPWLQQRGLAIPAWRLELLSLVARRRATADEAGTKASENPSKPLQQALEVTLAPLIQHDLAGLLLEVGPMILPCLPSAEGQWPAVLRKVVTPLRGWQAHPPRQRTLFSGKESEVLALLIEGTPNKSIARALGISENTVKFHLKNIFQKLEVDNRAAAIRVALQQGLGASA
ncbi:MAG: LuxR family transcriptional regulator [Ideonella sp. MAG2]|nr:MAG: LuxR family transcriptional regulator [Ideonella sp. MAG2]